jgi:hypothetical protein
MTYLFLTEKNSGILWVPRPFSSHIKQSSSQLYSKAKVQKAQLLLIF